MVKQEVIFKNAISKIKNKKIEKENLKIRVCNSDEYCVVSYSYFCFDFSGKKIYTRFVMPSYFSTTLYIQILKTLC